MVLPSPVLAGDWPDPSVIRVDEDEYVAVTTAGGWAPIVRLLRTPDLREWRIGGDILPALPGWAWKDFWAPEITKLGNGYAVFFSARSRNRKVGFCVGVATAPGLAGPWRAAPRPLRCGRYGSIDPFPTRDERGRLYLLWKEDGNDVDRPTPIFAQPLREDAGALLGRPRELIRNDRRWERRVVEGPAVVRRPDGYFYLFYSGNLCCTRKCRYAVGVARSPTLIGRWRKYPGTPILRGGNGWSCPGHGSFVDDGEGQLMYVFHAYRTGQERLAGRQVLVAPVSFGPSGWPAIGDGRPSPPSAGAAGTGFDEDFSAPYLGAEWEWPLRRTPGIAVGDGLRLRAPGRGAARIDGGVISRRVGTATYTATVILDRAALRGAAMGGLSAYRSGFEAVGISAGLGRVMVWQRRKGRFRKLRTSPLPPSPQVHLRMIGRGQHFRFEMSTDGGLWQRVGGTYRGHVEEAARLALTVGGARYALGRFISAKLE